MTSWDWEHDRRMQTARLSRRPEKRREERDVCQRSTRADLLNDWTVTWNERSRRVLT